ncbi:hypothetical protein D3C72_1095200 [compost metagenome]
MPITAVHDNTKTTAEINVPVSVARGMFFSGFRICAAGIVADSIPKNDHKVKAAVSKNTSGNFRSSGLMKKFSGLKYRKPTVPISRIGNSLKMVVIN